MNAYLEKRDRYLMAQARHQLYETPIVFERGDMDLLYDVDGKEYIDCFSGIMVVNFGHCNKEINAELHKQIDKLQHVSTFFLTRPLLDWAEKMAEITPDGLTRSFFVNSGSEAVDSAILLARAYTGNNAVICAKYGYHGRTLLTASCTNVSPSLQIDPRAAGLDIHFADNDYGYRYPANDKPGFCEGVPYTKDVEDKIALNNNKIAAILVEPIQGVGGVITPSEAWLKRMEELAHAAGGLLIVDEVQCGFGRTGRNFFSCDRSYSPDILTAAKGIANGVAAGAFVAKDEIGECYKIPTFATFGGSPMAAAASLASIDYMQKHDIPKRARESGERYKKGFAKIRDTHGLIGDIRGEGLFLGIELVKDENKTPATEETLAIMNYCSEHGLIVGKSGPKTNIIRVGPPLVITDEHIDRSLEILDDAFRSVVQK